MSHGAKRRRERLCETGRRRLQHTASTDHLLWWQTKGRQLIALAFGSHARVAPVIVQTAFGLTKRSRDGAYGTSRQIRRRADRECGSPYREKGDDLSTAALPPSLFELRRDKPYF
jgi:hypothetical protein